MLKLALSVKPLSMITVDADYYVKKLEQDFVQKQRVNAAFSLRAYAKLLGIHAPTLSAVLNRKRPLPLKIAQAILPKLKLSPLEKKRFLSSLILSRGGLAQHSDLVEPSRQSRLLNDELHHQIIAEWEHYAVLTLMETREFRSDARWIAGRLGISDLQARNVIQNLLNAGLIVPTSTGGYEKSDPRVSTSEDVVSAALQKSHREALEMGLQKLEQIPVRERDYSSISIAVAPNRLDEAKSLIRQFRKNLAELLEDGAQTEVYQLCIQLYPLTQKGPQKAPMKKGRTRNA